MVWRTTGWHRDGPRAGTRHPLTDSEPQEPQIAQERTPMRAHGESNQ